MSLKINFTSSLIAKTNNENQSQWNEPWNRKYTKKSSALPMSQVQRLGRQILEALLFLRERGFPSHGHLHSGNVILQNGVARYVIYDLFFIIFHHTCHRHIIILPMGSVAWQIRFAAHQTSKKKIDLCPVCPRCLLIIVEIVRHIYSILMWPLS